MKALLFVTIAAAAASLVLAQGGSFAPNTPYGLKTDKNGNPTIVQGCDSAEVLACATLDDGIWTNGWYTLNLQGSDNGASDTAQAHSAGYLEGALTQQSMWNSFATWVNGTSYTWPAPAVHEFAMAQDKWVRGMIATPPAGQTEYWAAIGQIYAQFDGMLDGYAAYAPAAQQLAYDQWLAFQLQSEIGDYMAGLNLSNPADIDNPLAQHCSSLVKLTPGNEALYASQDTWSSFNSMLRIFKHVDLSFHSGGVVGGSSFSSYPGAIASIDDYYITSANLVVMETTNGVMNSTLYQMYISTQTVPYWARVTAANRLSTSGEEWMTAFGMYNSGSYNNQWIIVDNKKFTKGVGVSAGALWIGEQVPGFFVNQDMTDTLVSDGYWASYNIPYFPFIWNISGYPAFFNKYGNEYSHDHCARANIFRRDAPAVASLDDMKHIMRYNEWQTDDLSLQDSCRGISARCDLNPPWANNPLNSYSAFGAIDSKITSDAHSAARTTIAVAGPTWDSQPVFAWTHQWDGVPHYGQPNVFAFDWMAQVPQQPM